MRYLILFILVGISPLYAQPELDMERFYDGGNGGDSFYDVYQCTNNDYLVCGWTTNRTPWAMRLNSEGNQIWSYQNAGSGLYSIIEADNEDAVTTGNFINGFGVARLDSEGEAIWENNYADGGSGNAIIELKDGGFAAAGSGGNGRACIIRIDEDGELIWRNFYSEQNEVRRVLRSMRETDGGIVSAGFHQANNMWNGIYGWVQKVDFDGEMLWSQSFQFQDSSLSFVDMISLPNGGFALAANRNFDRAFILFKINDVGDLTLSTRIRLEPASYYSLYGLDKFENGSLVFVGRRSVNGSFFPIAVKTDSDGEVIWVKNFEERGGRENGAAELQEVIVRGNDVIIGAGTYVNDNGSPDGYLVRLEPDNLVPQILYRSPEDSSLTVLIDDTIQFIVRARDRDGNELAYEWFRNDSTLGDEDTTITIRFVEDGRDTISCRISNIEFETAITWHVTVTDLFIASHSPDTLDLTLRRGSTVDFSIDSVAAVGDEQPVLYQWLLNDLDRQEEVSGGDAQATTFDFIRSGHYTVEGLAYRGEASDAVVWDVEVRGAIWSFLPEELNVERLEGENVEFQIIPTISDTVNWFTWLYDGGMIQEGRDSVFVMNLFEVGEHTVTGILADSVESDTVEWVVNVLDPSATPPTPPSIEGGDLPRQFGIASVSPNPFNAMLTIRFSVGAQGLAPLHLAVYDLSGREVARFIEATTLSPPSIEGGERVVTWNASAVPAGVYLVRLQQGEQVSTKKVVLLR